MNTSGKIVKIKNKSSRFQVTEINLASISKKDLEQLKKHTDMELSIRESKNKKNSEEYKKDFNNLKKLYKQTGTIHYVPEESNSIFVTVPITYRVGFYPKTFSGSCPNQYFYRSLTENPLSFIDSYDNIDEEKLKKENEQLYKLQQQNKKDIEIYNEAFKLFCKKYRITQQEVFSDICKEIHNHR